MRVSVIGGSEVTAETATTARRLGRELGERGHEVVCGGLTGVMEAVAQGVAEGVATPSESCRATIPRRQTSTSTSQS